MEKEITPRVVASPRRGRPESKRLAAMTLPKIVQKAKMTIRGSPRHATGSVRIGPLSTAE